MSWDVFIQDLPNVSCMEDISENFKPQLLGRRVDLINRIKEVVPMADFSDPAWGTLDTDDFSVEFNMGENDEVDCITCHIRGVSGGGACVAEIVKRLGLKALDSATGDFMDFNNPELGFEKWKVYRNRCMEDLS